jgi:Transposase DDE domain
MKDAILRNFRKVVTSQFISEKAQKNKFNQRSTGHVRGIDFMQMLIMQAGSGREMNYSNLNATLTGISSSINISNQALSKYFYKKSSVDFVKSIYEKVFLFQKESLLRNYNKEIDQNTLNLFKRILIEDSTICVLNEKLETEYKGTGGSASKSSLKIDVIHELKTSAIVKLSISSGNIPDVCFANSILKELEDNDLILRDLGYFKLGEMDQLDKKNAFYISRYKNGIKVFLKENSEPIDLGRFLAKTYSKFPNEIIDMVVLLGEEKLKTRLIAYKVPAEISNERRRKAKKKARTELSEGRLNLYDYVILITNIPSNRVKSEVIGTIYRIRWTIELIFKTWKSQLNLQLNLKGYKITRIECFIYATLIICLLTTLIHGWLKKAISSIEISLDKLSKLLMNRSGYYRLLWGRLSSLKNEIYDNMRRVKTQKRKRKTTLERVIYSEPYSEKYIKCFLIG